VGTVSFRTNRPETLLWPRPLPTACVFWVRVSFSIDTTLCSFFGRFLLQRSHRLNSPGDLSFYIPTTFFFVLFRMIPRWIHFIPD
jgi:hypothetical protein